MVISNLALDYPTKHVPLVCLLRRFSTCPRLCASINFGKKLILPVTCLVLWLTLKLLLYEELYLGFPDNPKTVVYGDAAYLGVSSVMGGMLAKRRGYTIRPHINNSFPDVKRVRKAAVDIPVNVKFEKLGALTASLLHDIANPLTAAVINLDSLPGKQPSEIINARSQLHLANEYITATRNQMSGTIINHSFNVHDELSKIIKMLEYRTLAEHIILRYTCPKSCVLFGNEIAFDQIVSNLLSNSIDSYSNLKQPMIKLISVNVSEYIKYVVITVTDHGSGIDKHIRSRIFEPFYSTKSKGSLNMGIGLCTIKQQVEQVFGGHISVRSSNNTGTIFTVKLSSDYLKTIYLVAPESKAALIARGE